MAGRVVKFPEEKISEPAGEEFYDIVATIDGTEVWREIYVPGTCALDEFAAVLITAFAWDGGHIWFFEDVNSRTIYDDPAAPESDFPAPEGETHVPAEEATVAQLFPAGHAHVRFVYDLGDWWEITLEQTGTLPEYAYPFSIVPVCIDGEMMAPLEDVGGVGGWERFCEIVRDPDDPDYEDYRTWAGLEADEEFDEAYFSTRDVNFNIALGMASLSKDALPDDVEELKEIVVALTADNKALETDNMVMMGNMMGALSSLQDQLGLPDLFGDEGEWK